MGKLLGVRKLFAVLVLSVLVGAAVVGTRAHPALEVKRLVFAYPVAAAQRVLGLEAPSADGTTVPFAYEDPAALRELRTSQGLDAVVAGAPGDFDRWVRLMHWVRDRFPHGRPVSEQDPQAFDGGALLAGYRSGGYLCSTAAQLLVQAITAMGGVARRVDLRFTPDDTHVVVEAWCAELGKWVVLDPDYDVYYTVDGVPQHALELHRRWAANDVDAVEVHARTSPHNIYRKEDEALDRALVRHVYETHDDAAWTAARASHRRERFAVKLLCYYAHVSHPLRNDWLTRPLAWWHPEGNHVQDSVVVGWPTMRTDEDFLLIVDSPDALYAPPPGRTGARDDH